MLQFSEGVPRSGKSYDAVKEHILPALRAERHVYARLDGLNLDAIAAYLSMAPDRVRGLLHHVPTDEVLTTFVATREEAGWSIAPALQNAVFIVDECHEFYVSSREALPPAIENFYALHGKNGMDGVILSQHYKRLHSAIRGRIERKNVFQKLTAVGFKGKYRQTFYQTIAPDKYEKTGSVTKKYDAAIFPLYKGYADGASNTEVYDSGGQTVWSGLKTKAIVMGIIGVCAVVVLARFFTGSSAMVKNAPVVQGVAAHVAPAALSAAGGAAPAAPSAPPKKPRKLTDTQEYVWKLSDDDRARILGRATLDGQDVAVIEWRDNNDLVKETLTTKQLQDMGVAVTFKSFGVQMIVDDLKTHEHLSIIATAWPVTEPQRDQAPVLYNTSGTTGRSVGVPSVASHADGVAAFTSGKHSTGSGSDGSDAPAIAHYGGMRSPAGAETADTYGDGQGLQ